MCSTHFHFYSVSLNEKPQTIDPYTSHWGSLVSAGVAATVEAPGFVGGGSTAQIIIGGRGAAQRLVGRDDQLLGSVTLEYGGNITAPVLDIQTNVSEYPKVNETIVCLFPHSFIVLVLVIKTFTFT